MNNKKIVLGNERCQHLTKRLNRLSIWGFFKYLYNNQAIKLLLTNLLMLVFFAPCLVFVVLAVIDGQELLSLLPTYGSLTSAGGFWMDVTATYQQQLEVINSGALWKGCLGALALTFVLSGGLAVIRDAFWSGKLTVFKSFFRGVKANFGYAFATSVILSATAYGFVNYIWFSQKVMAPWLSITTTIVLGILMFLLTLYLFVLCSVTVTYKQTVKQNLADALNMVKLNFLHHASRFLVMLLPVFAYLLLGQALFLIVLLFMLMLGFFYFPFVWQTHMMKVFAIFHPVAVNKKGEPKKQQGQQEMKLEEANN